MICSVKTNAFEVQGFKLLKNISIVMRPNQFHWCMYAKDFIFFTFQAILYWCLVLHNVNISFTRYEHKDKIGSLRI